MKLRVKETGKFVEINWLDENGIDCTADIASETYYEAEDGELEMSQENVIWWRNIIYKKDFWENKLKDLCEWRGLIKKDIEKKIYEDAGPDLESQIDMYQAVTEELLIEYSLTEDELEEIGEEAIGVKIADDFTDVHQLFQTINDVVIEKNETLSNEEWLYYEASEDIDGVQKSLVLIINPDNKEIDSFYIHKI